MYEASVILHPISEVADTNPETLPATTPGKFRFRYIDLSSVENGFINWGAVDETTYGTAPSRARRVVQPLDVLFGTVRPNLKSHGLINVRDYGPLVASTGFSVIRAKDGISHPVYLFHSLMSGAVGAQAERDAVGSSYPAVNDADVRRFQIFLPPYGEQETIAKILDTLDTAIHETEAIIAKLKAVKQGLLHDLLTRGIDANGELRPPQPEAPHLYKQSPLGWIPKEWEVAQAESVCDAVIDCKNRTPPITESGHPVVRTSNVRDGRFVYEGLAFTDKASYRIWTQRGRPRPGDVLITREAPVGEVCLVPANMQDACLGQRMMMYQPNPAQLRNTFMLVALISQPVQRILIDKAGGSTVGHVRVGDIRSLEIPIPPLPEQELIAERYQTAANRLNAEERSLAKLNGSKAGLMDDLLTGRVRVTPLLEEAAS
ncbi:restriction endonuclease subunit S [Pseudogulbenkiania sp. MAI-1]|uniref:restriction endonuclease subunit S n=1 Tax=Pseudogulbenkiania sp. MAI-1 TaxID=990370 RepID=UPI00045E64E4|nr:restriction endonuclease subunit S [Pseudogulbenkiania sp. MAI-1]